MFRYHKDFDIHEMEGYVKKNPLRPSDQLLLMELFVTFMMLDTEQPNGVTVDDIVDTMGVRSSKLDELMDEFFEKYFEE
jgi:hypothetical protein